jgi:hypothetical protein
MAEIARPYDEQIKSKQEELKRLSKLRIGVTGVKLGLTLAITKLANTRAQKLEEVLTDVQRAKLHELRSKN